MFYRLVLCLCSALFDCVVQIRGDICDSCAVKFSIKYGENVYGEVFPHIEFCSQRLVGLGWHRRLVQLAEHEKAGTPDLLLGFGNVHAHLSLPRVLRQNQTDSKRGAARDALRKGATRERKGARPVGKAAISSSFRRSSSVLLFVSGRCSLLQHDRRLVSVICLSSASVWCLQSESVASLLIAFLSRNMVKDPSTL